MDAVQSIFAQMRKSRGEAAIAAMNESVEETKVEETVETPAEETPAVDNVNEGVEETPAQEETVETPAEETPAQEEHIDEAEEFVVIRCHDCGAILSALDEAEEGCPVCGSEDLDEKTVKVVREGKVVKKNVKTKKRRLTAAQKAALAKARKKAHTAGANKKRAKSNAVRNKKGMNEGDSYTCPDCGYEGEYDDFDEEDGVLICPECGAELDEDCGSKKGK